MSTQTPPKPSSSKDPLHGMTLEMILTRLVEHYGWPELGRIIEIKCFNEDPSIKSSLTFLRRNQWARDHVETLFKEMVSAAKTET